jgi:hypothetical protein
MRNTANQITRAFFQRNQQAVKIREACIDFLHAWNQLSEATNIDRAVPESNLEAARERLVELGVTPGMHVGQDFEFFRTRPMAAAEFCAGQLLMRPSTEADTAQLNKAYFNLDNVGSHDVAEGVEMAILQPGRAGHAQCMELCVSRDLVRMVASLLDAESEVFCV